MATRPDLTTLIGRNQDAIERKIPGSNPRARRGVLPALAHAVAGASHELHGRIETERFEMHPLNAKGERLRGWAASYGVYPIAGTRASGIVVATGTDGKIINEGDELRSADGVLYAVTADAVIAAGTALVSVEALEIGEQANQDAGANLAFSKPIDGVALSVTVDVAGIKGGLNDESEESLQDKLLFAMQNPPGGGSDADYIRWAFEADQRVVKVFPPTNEQGDNWVTVRFMAYGHFANGIPDEALRAKVEAYIAARRPITAKLAVVAPIPQAQDLTFSSLTPDTPAVRAAILAEFTDLLIREAAPAGTVKISRIRESISLASGESDHVLTTPNANITTATGTILVPGDIIVTE